MLGALTDGVEEIVGEPRQLGAVLVGDPEYVDHLPGGEPLRHELLDGLLRLLGGLRIWHRDLPGRGGEPIEEADLVAQLDHRRLGSSQRIPLGGRGLSIEELLARLLGAEHMIQAVEEELRTVGFGHEIELALPVPRGVEQRTDALVLLPETRDLPGAHEPAGSVSMTRCRTAASSIPRVAAMAFCSSPGCAPDRRRRCGPVDHRAPR